LIFPVRDYQETKKNENQGILQHPVGHIGSTNKGVNPNREKNNDKANQPVIGPKGCPKGRNGYGEGHGA